MESSGRGAGFMGTGIAQVSAQAGCQVPPDDIQPRLTENPFGIFVGRWKNGRQRCDPGISDQVLARFHRRRSVHRRQVDWVLKRSWKRRPKRGLFKNWIGFPPQLSGDQYLFHSHHAPLRKHPAARKSAGLHFFGLLRYAMVEVVKGEQTSPECLSVVSLYSIAGKTPVRVQRDIRLW